MALSIKPTVGEYYNNKGYTLVALNKYDLAIKYYEKALQQNPLHAQAYNNLGFAYKSQGKNAEAIKY